MVDEELVWRKSKENKKDVKLSLDLLTEIRNLGYNYNYLADITNRQNDDKELLNVILKYIGKFDDEGISAELVGVVGKENYIEATGVVLNNYINSSLKTKFLHSFFYDKALSKIKDKRYMKNYLELLENPETAIKLPFTMIMLGKWKIEEAKPIFIKYLDSTLLYLNNDTSDLVFIAIEALSNYYDEDGNIKKQLEKKLNSKDKYVVKFVKRAIEKNQPKSNFKY